MSKMYRLMPSGNIKEIEVVPALRALTASPIPGKFKIPGRYGTFTEGHHVFSTHSGAVSALSISIAAIRDRIARDQERVENRSLILKLELAKGGHL